MEELKKVVPDGICYLGVCRSFQRPRYEHVRRIDAVRFKRLSGSAYLGYGEQENILIYHTEPQNVYDLACIRLKPLHSRGSQAIPSG
jgi:hypothetical protein